MKNFNVFSISLTFYIFGSCIYEINSQNVTLKGLSKDKVTLKSGNLNHVNLKNINGHFSREQKSNTNAKGVHHIVSKVLKIKRPTKSLNIKRSDNVMRYRKDNKEFEDIFGQTKNRHSSDIWNPKQHTFGYENFFYHPNRANIGKLFNQGDIDDIYLNGNHEYKRLVKDYHKQIFHPESGSTYVGGDISSISGGNIFGTTGKRPKIFHSTIGLNNLKKKNFHNENFDYTSHGFGKSSGFESLRNSYGDLIGNADGWTPEKLPDSIFKQDGLYGQKLGFKTAYDPEKFYNLDTESTVDTTPNPFKSLASSHPLESYASKFNFGSKPYPDNEPTKYSKPFNFGKYSLKNTGIVSEFDYKGSPLGYSSTVSPVNHPNKVLFDTNKEATSDFEKAFYDLNKSNNFGSSFNFADVQPSESTAASNAYFGHNKGYASTFNYQPSNSYQGSESSDSILKNFDFNKYSNYLAYDKNVKSSGSRSPVEISHPIIIPVPHPYPVKVPIAKPVAVPILKEIKVPIEKVVPYPVFKKIPYPIEKRIPVTVEKQIPVPVPRPYPVKIPVIKNVYHHSRDRDIPGLSSGHHFRGKDHQKNYQHENWDSEPETQHSHRETWKEGGRINKHPNRENWEEDSNHKESSQNEHWDHEKSHENEHRENWEENSPITSHRDTWEHEERYRAPEKDYWDNEGGQKNSQRENWEEEPRYKHSHRDSWEHESRSKSPQHHSWDEEPKRRPPHSQIWEKVPIRKPIHQSTWEHESYKSSHQLRNRGRHRDHRP